MQRRKYHETVVGNILGNSLAILGTPYNHHEIEDIAICAWSFSRLSFGSVMFVFRLVIFCLTSDD